MTTQNLVTEMSALPEGCIANVLSFTSPCDACNFSVVSSTFKNAAQSDTVWERFLPPDCDSIISRSSDSDRLLAYSKKQQFLSLCENSILIDDGKKSFALDKSTGKKCFMLSSTDLSIIWADTPHHWQWNSDSDSRFAEVAELIDVCWLEIRGKIKTDMLSRETNYGAYLVFKLNKGNYGLTPPAEAAVELNGSEKSKRSVCLDFYNRVRRRRIAGMLTNGGSLRASALEATSQRPNERVDRWMEVELGEFFNEDGQEQDGDLEISLLEVKNGNWKRGLIVEGIEIRPKPA